MATTALTCTIDGLDVGSQYSVVVTATNAQGESLPSAPSAIVTILPIPGIPGAPIITSVVAGDGMVRVNFKPGKGGTPTSYIVTSDPDGITCLTKKLYCIVDGLTNGTPYTFTVQAINDFGKSDPSKKSDPVTPLPGKRPATPIISNVASKNASIEITLARGAAGSLPTKYVVTAMPGGNACETEIGLKTCLIDELTNGTPYTVTAVAVNSAGKSLPSKASDPVTPNPLPGTPEAPSVGDVQAGNREVTVTIVPGGGGAASKYLVKASPDGATCTTEDTSCVVGGLDNGTTYTFKVIARNDIGDSAASAASAGATPDESLGVPNAPDAVNLVPGNGSIQVSIVSTSAGVPTKYYAVASPGGNSCTSSTPSCTITGLTNGTSYMVKVSASNKAGTSAFVGGQGEVVPSAH